MKFSLLTKSGPGPPQTFALTYDEHQFHANSKTGIGRGQLLTILLKYSHKETTLLEPGCSKRIVGEAREKSTSGVLIKRCSEAIERSNHMGLFTSLREVGRAESNRI
jgi:hypothetical protein